MIPADVASRLRLVLPDQPAPPQATTPARQLADALSELVPGQRVMAEIQALLPNGTYRAIVAQRDVTLALPFSAKPGDSLELEVVDTKGKLTLAVVAERAGNPATSGESVPTTLSPTGRLISDLLGGIDAQGKRAQPALLNGNQPVVNKFPENPAELVPLLKDALSKSGMFYEAHQARWIDGNLPKEALLQEPQGKLSTALPSSPTPPDKPAETAHQPTTALPAPSPEAAKQAAETPLSAPAKNNAVDATVVPRTPTTNIVPADLTPIVQQQLDALATQNFVWQGQVWPGQQMQWEIEENPERQPGGTDGADQWRTRLRLTLPNLGTIDASLRLRGGKDLELVLAADNEAARQDLAAGSEALGKRLEDSGLRLMTFKVGDGQQPQ